MWELQSFVISLPHRYTNALINAHILITTFIRFQHHTLALTVWVVYGLLCNHTDCRKCTLVSITILPFCSGMYIMDTVSKLGGILMYGMHKVCKYA